MKRLRSLALAVVLLAPGSLFSQPTAAPTRATDFDSRARAILEPVAAKYPGLAAAVAVDGRIVWSAAWGFADIDRKTAASPEMRVRIYSTAKPMTAAALARLAAEGKIDLDAPIRKYVPGFPEKAGPPVTARLLASHLGGIRHYQKGEAVSRMNCASPSDALSVFASDPLVSAPGSAENYSSYGYVLLSAAIEKASGKPFEEAMRDLVFEPAGMKETLLDRPGPAIPARAVPYDESNGKWKEFPDAKVTCKFGAGGFLSTVGDMVRFGTALLAGKIVPADRVAALFQPARTASGKEIDFGFGWGLTARGAGVRLPMMSGGNVGGRAALGIDPASNTVVAIAGNFEGPRLTQEARRLLELSRP